MILGEKIIYQLIILIAKLLYSLETANCMYQKMRLFAIFLVIITFSLLDLVDSIIGCERCFVLIREQKIKVSVQTLAHLFTLIRNLRINNFCSVLFVGRG